MVMRRLVPLALALVSGVGTRTARADGACVVIDTTRDNLGDQDRAAVQIAVAAALENEGVVVDRQGRCTGVVTIYNIQVGKRISTTIVSGQNHREGQASSINELDLLVRQLVRALVTGRAFATGTGVQDRENVLRDQTAPRRIEPSGFLWEPMIAVGGGMLQLPAIAGRPRQRQYNIVSIDARYWGYASSLSYAIEFRTRLLLHDYAVIGDAADNFDESTDGDKKIDGDEFGYAWAMVLSPLAVANWDMGIGAVRMFGDQTPHPYLRGGVEVSALCRFSDPAHRFDVGPGAYVGLGMMLTPGVSLAVEANMSRPLFHSQYAYFLTTTAMIEFRGKPDPSFSPFQPEPVPTIRRINE